MLEIKQFVFNLFGENCYVVSEPEQKRAFIVDPGCRSEIEKEELNQYIAGMGLNVEAILLTHAHFDHIFGLKDCADAYGVPVYLHPDDRTIMESNGLFARRFGMSYTAEIVPTSDICDGGTLHLAGADWTVITTPGHTPGCVCYHCPSEGVIFTGDTLFRGTIGRTDHPLGDYDKEIVSIMDKIMGLDGATAVYPGHGPGTTISDERTHNPFLEPFNELEQEDWDAEGLQIHA